ncbi:30S ribosomal protein S10 [Candidatus Uhrbacteria bacterium RIFCSPLOWO2_02_FULL_51_9]|uniref:Small ribosomal subunit protein uS10 n=1 Tax=Candidatus Uhrbacteria bacterium RIFCSPLOWO2_02_FULL_51_9 TaxID=1802410 RepID=A0A1F7VCQ0_9BACT|nr:MAG: 30S ribosomal protein S10 [Candidatus Uhrbacteria bacterium RIFCSPLOWO2_02_FULL_51_9]
MVSAAKTKKSDVKTDEGVQTRIRLKIRAFDNKIIDQATKTIVETAERNNATIVGPVPLPTEKKKYTVNRSTFVHKDAREQFEMRVHKRMVDIMNPSAKVIDAMMNLNLPSGVDVEIKM